MNSIDKIPKTGRIGRFAKIIKKEVPKDLFLGLLKNSDKYGSFSPSKKAEWWKNTIIRMENELGHEKTKEIMTLYVEANAVVQVTEKQLERSLKNQIQLRNS